MAATSRPAPCRACCQRRQTVRSACGSRDRRGSSARRQEAGSPRRQRSEPPAVLSRASVAPNVRLAASGEGEGGSSCFFLTCVLREEDLAVRGDDTGIVGPPFLSIRTTATVRLCSAFGIRRFEVSR